MDSVPRVVESKARGVGTHDPKVIDSWTRNWFVGVQ